MSWVLFKILIPLSIITKILKEVGAVDQLGIWLGPVMHMVGLPGSMGLVWATAMVTNLYGGIVVFASLAPDAHLTVAQVTVLTTMMLLAHCLPIELRIAQKAGARLRLLLVLRVASALTLGWLLHRVYSATGYLQRPASLLWKPPAGDPSWGAWAVGEVRTLCMIFLIVLGLIIMLRILNRLGVTALLTRLLEPVLTGLGISRKAAPLTIVGMLMGMAYGGAFIIQEAVSGRLTKRDVVFSLALMSLCHSLFEDTLLMMALGAHGSGILWARLAFALTVVFVLVRLLRRAPEAAFDRFFSRGTPTERCHS